MAVRRLNLSGTQVSAAVLATLTGAIAASYLGVAGTLVGAAVGSLASTVGTEVYRHYLGRTQERLRGAVVTRRYRATGHTVMDRADPAVAQNRVGVTSRRQAAVPDAAETEILHMRRPGETAHPAASPRSTGPDDPVDDSRTEALPALDGWSRAGHGQTAAARAGGVGSVVNGSVVNGSAGAGRAGNGSGGAKGGGNGSAGAVRGGNGSAGAVRGGNGSGGAKRSRPRWLVLAGIAAVTFLVALAALTVFELSVGKPLNALLWNRSGGGTTVGGVIGAHNTRPAPAHTQTATPSAQPTTSASASGSVTPTPSPSPTLGGTPTSSGIPSPGGPANTSPAATASP
jgi:hypothetical protein